MILCKKVVWGLLLVPMVAGVEAQSRISDERKAKAIDFMEHQAAVSIAKIEQEGEKVNLTVEVRRYVDKTQAGVIGANFIRVLKSVATDTPISNGIGTGVYDYRVVVVYAGDLDPIVRLIKRPNDQRVSFHEPEEESPPSEGPDDPDLIAI